MITYIDINSIDTNMPRDKHRYEYVSEDVWDFAISEELAAEVDISDYYSLGNAQYSYSKAIKIMTDSGYIDKDSIKCIARKGHVYLVKLSHFKSKRQ